MPAEEGVTTVQIKDFPGLVIEVDTHDLPAGSSNDQVNCTSDDIGVLKSRGGYSVLKFEGE
jgi:hypothetical protein